MKWMIYWMNKPVIIIGNGGHASVLVEIIQDAQIEIIGYTAPEEGSEFYNLPYLGDDDVVVEHHVNEIELVLGIGTITVSNLRKKKYAAFKSKGYTFATIIHPSAIISPTVAIGEGTQIMAGAIIQTQSVLGENLIINTGAQIDHNSLIQHHSHIAPGVVLSGNVSVGENCHIGAGTTIIQNITIGNRVLIGAGSLVLKNVEDDITAYGVPAQEV